MPLGNPLKQKLAAGQTCVGVWLLTSSADVAEIIAHGGMDFVIIDHEHGQGNIQTAIDQLRALKGTECTGVLRVPSNDYIYIKRALDAGVGGIMVPNVSDSAQARHLVAACQYPPQGIRGAFGGMRAMQYGFNSNYYGKCFDDLVVVAQVENTKAIDRIPEIAAVPGIDIIFIGPRDLSATLGKLNKFDDPVVRAEIERAERAILSTGKLLGSTAASSQIAKEMTQRGYRFIVAGSDATLLGQAARKTVLDTKA